MTTLEFNKLDDEVVARTPEGALNAILIELRKIRQELTKAPNSTFSHHAPEVPAGIGRVAVVDVHGNFFLCGAASARFKMQFDDGQVFPCVAGLMLSTKPFNRITIFNESAADVLAVEFYASNTPLGYSGLIAG